MKDKKGFIAISLLYAFFLIFIMLMVGILATTTQNRILVGALKNTIRENIADSINTSLLFDTIQVDREYKVGEKALFAGETWFVIEDSASDAETVKLILARVLREDELKKSLGVTKAGTGGIGEEYIPSEIPDFYMLDNEIYKIRGCRNPSKHNPDNQSNEFCFRYASTETPLASYNVSTDNAGILGTNYTAPSYNDKYPFIPAKITKAWFNNHKMLKALSMRIKTSSIGASTNIYARLPYISEIENLTNGHAKYEAENDWGEDWIRDMYPFHLADGQTDKSIKIVTLNDLTQEHYNVVDAPSYYGAYIRPVIEVKKT